MNFRLWLVIISVIFLFAACKTSFYAPKTVEKKLNENLKFKNSFHGVSIYDLDKKQYIVNYNEDKYFIPASNTKLFTFYAGLRLLGEKSTALYYTTVKDSLIFWGAGDGSLFYPNVGNDSTAAVFLKKQNRQLFYSPTNFKDDNLGDGWAWNDIPYYYAAERSALPIYGNLALIDYEKENDVNIYPKFFTPFLKKDNSTADDVTRNIGANNFTYKAKSKPYADIVSFKTSPQLTAQLLSDTLKKKVTLINYPISKKTIIAKLEGIAMDSIYKEMMYESDNYLTEQILLACSAVLPDNNYELNTQKTIEYMLKTDLADLSQKPRWVDGSGLSRYNLMTPRSIIELLLKIYAEADKQPNGEKRLFDLLPSPGRKGTLKNTKAIYPPTLYAKTGTLSNNHSLSGYLVTKSGKKLCFSFMNNHFQVPTADIRKEMGAFLKDFYENY